MASTGDDSHWLFCVAPRDSTLVAHTFEHSLDGVGACRVQVTGDRSCPDPWGQKPQGISWHCPKLQNDFPRQ